MHPVQRSSGPRQAEGADPNISPVMLPLPWVTAVPSSEGCRGSLTPDLCLKSWNYESVSISIMSPD